MIAAVGGVSGEHNNSLTPQGAWNSFFFCLDGHPSTDQPRTTRLNISAFFSQAAGLTLLALGIYTAKYGTGVGAR